MHDLPLITVDLHCHTVHSPDSLIRPVRLLEICERKGIERLAITDHNTIEGALEAAALDPTRFIVGEEIKTTEGELLGYFMQERIPPRLSPEETIGRLRDQGAFISVAHPLDPLRGGAWSEVNLRRILPLVDALEVFNARTLGSAPNDRAKALAEEAGLLGTAGSDAHGYVEVGRAGLRLPAFEDAVTMKEALNNAEVVGRLSSPFVHLISRYAVWRKARDRRRGRLPGS